MSSTSNTRIWESGGYYLGIIAIPALAWLKYCNIIGFLACIAFSGAAIAVGMLCNPSKMRFLDGLVFKFTLDDSQNSLDVVLLRAGYLTAAVLMLAHYAKINPILFSGHISTWPIGIILIGLLCRGVYIGALDLKPASLPKYQLLGNIVILCSLVAIAPNPFILMYALPFITVSLRPILSLHNIQASYSFASESWGNLKRKPQLYWQKELKTVIFVGFMIVIQWFLLLYFGDMGTV